MTLHMFGWFLLCGGLTVVVAGLYGFLIERVRQDVFGLDVSRPGKHDNVKK